MKRKIKYTVNIGDRFGFLTVEHHPAYCPTSAMVSCRCDCGKKRLVYFGSLIQGLTKSCGCLRDKMIARVGKRNNRTHGKSYEPIYAIWNSMRSRCNNSNSISYRNYGGRGIRVCERWMSFKNFYSDMGERPSNAYQIDRINPNGNYEPENCRWADNLKQQNNRCNNHKLTYNGTTMTMAEWARSLGVSRQLLYQRLRRKWPTWKVLFIQPSHPSF